MTTTLAMAGAKQATVSVTTFYVDGGEFETEYAECPGKKRALGGGVVQSGDFPVVRMGANGPLDASGKPSDTKDGDIAKRWFGAIDQANNSSGDYWKVVAICARVPGATLETATFSVDHNEVGKTLAKCPGSKRALGGGVVPFGSPKGMYITASGPVDKSGEVSQTKDGDVAKQWLGALFNGSEVSHRKVKVFAICAEDSGATIETTKFNAKPLGGAGEGLTVCEGLGQRIIGGGVAPISPPTNQLWVTASGPLGSSGTGSGTKDGDVAEYWYAAVINSAGTEQAYKVSAICV